MQDLQTKEQQFLIDGITSDLALYLVEDEDMTVAEALNTIYNSDYYLLLSDPETELYLRGSLNNYHYLRNELKHSRG